MKKDPVLNWIIYPVSLIVIGTLIVNGPALTHWMGVISGTLAALVCLKLWFVYNRWTGLQYRYQGQEVMLALNDGSTVRGIVADTDHELILGGHLLMIHAEKYRPEGEGPKIETIEGPDVVIQVEESTIKELAYRGESSQSQATVH